MEIRWLEAFVAVAEEMHFGRAADRLHMAQSPLSQMIRRLERQVGTTLFERSTRSVSLTASGVALLPHAYQALRTLNNAIEAARSADGEPIGQITLGFSGVHNHHTLPRLARALRRTYPSIELKLIGGIRTFDGLRLVRNGELDAAFVGILGAPEAPLMIREISRQHLGVVVHSDHRLASRGTIALQELRNDPFIMGPVDGNSSMTVLARQACLAAGFAPFVVQTVSDPFLILSMVAAGVGVTIVSSEVMAILPESTAWLELEGASIPFRHGLTWSEENQSVTLMALTRVVDDVFPDGVFAPETPTES